MTESNIEPQNISIDSITSGIAIIRVRWNKEPVERAGIDDTITLWQYDECRMEWILPQVYTSISDVQTYLDANYTEGEKILDWAMGSKVNL